MEASGDMAIVKPRLIKATIKNTAFALTLLLAACAPQRDTSTPAQLLIGHWLQDNENGRVHFCFSKNGVHTIRNENDGTINQFSYTIGTQYTKKKALEFSTDPRDRRIARFSKDGNTAEITLLPLEKPYTTWKYVDTDTEKCGG
jgi:hypothetical protein